MSGWQRLGLVASIVWIFGAGFFEAKRASDLYQWVFATDYQICSNYDSGEKDCVDEAKRNARPWVIDRWINVATLVVLPVPLTWLAGWVVFGAVRWLRRVFKVGGADHD